VAATIPEYVDPLLRRQAAASNMLGTYIFGSGKEVYNIDLTVLTLIAVIMKALNDKGVVLDAEWLTRLSTSLNGTWPDWILNQHDPDAVPG
jgi:hypothetical protein